MKDIERITISTAKVFFGETSGKAAYNEAESWWLNAEVHQSVKIKIQFLRDTNKKGQQDQHVTTVQGSQRGSKQISSHCKGARI